MNNCRFMHKVYADGEKLTKMHCDFSELLESVKKNEMYVIGREMNLAVIHEVLGEDRFIKILELILEYLDEDINQFNFNMNGFLEIFKKDKGAE